MSEAVFGLAPVKCEGCTTNLVTGEVSKVSAIMETSDDGKWIDIFIENISSSNLIVVDAVIRVL